MQVIDDGIRDRGEWRSSSPGATTQASANGSTRIRDHAEHRAYELFVLNLALQLFDAVATYQGLKVGWREGNPILVTAFGYLGVGPTLLLFKAKACGLLFLLNRNRHHPMVLPALYVLAAVYTMMSLIPWTAKFIGLLIESL